MSASLSFRRASISLLRCTGRANFPPSPCSIRPPRRRRHCPKKALREEVAKQTARADANRDQLGEERKRLQRLREEGKRQLEEEAVSAGRIMLGEQHEEE